MISNIFTSNMKTMSGLNFIDQIIAYTLAKLLVKATPKTKRKKKYWKAAAVTLDRNYSYSCMILYLSILLRTRAFWLEPKISIETLHPFAT